MRRTVLLLFLFAGAAAAAGLDVERSIGPLRSGPTTPWQGLVHGASDGEDFLITWEDARSAYPANVLNFPHVAMAQRVDADGHVLATLTLPFAGTTIWSGSTYVVANGAQYVRVSRDGQLLDATPMTLPVLYIADMASNGSRVLAVSITSAPTWASATLSATLFDADMHVIKTVPLAADVDQATIAVAANANGFAVFYGVRDSEQRLNRMRAIVLDPDANIVRGSFDILQMQYGIAHVKAAADETRFLIALSTWNPSVLGGMNIAAAAIDRNNAISMVANPLTDLLIIGKNWIDGTEWALSATPGGFQVVDSRFIERDLTVSLIPVGTLTAPGAPMATFIPSATPKQYALFTNRRGRSLLLWSHKIYQNADAEQEVFTGDTFASLDDFAAHRGASFRLGDGPFTQESMSAAVAPDGTALVAWRERVDATGRLALYAARIAPDGTILDPDSLRLADATTDGTRPAVVSDGRDFFVAWSEPERIVVRRVARDARLGPPTVISTGAVNRTSSPALTWNGSEFLLAFNNRELQPDATYTWTTQAVRLDANGALIGFPAAINAPLRAPTYPVNGYVYSYLDGPLAASDGRDFLVLYTKRATLGSQNPTTSDASAVTRITAAGAVTTANVPIVLHAAKALFWSGKTYVALDSANGGFNAVRISAEALPLDGFPAGEPQTSGPLLPGYPNQLAVQPLCDASGCYAAGLGFQDGAMRLFSWRVTDATGAFDRSAPTPAATVVAPIINGAGAIALPGPTSRIVYARLAPEPELLDVMRIFLRTEKPPRHRAAR